MAHHTSKLAKVYDTRFQQLMKRYGIPGGAYAIVYGDRILAVRGFGTRRKGRNQPVTAHTVFRLASVSKTFAASLAALLESERKLSWDSPVTEQVNGVKLRTVDPKQPVTINHLLSHTTGFTPHAYDNLINDGVNLDKIYAKLGRLTPLCTPGRCYGYQNVLFSLIQPTISTATGQGYEELLQRRLFAPLAMNDASVGMEGFKASRNRAQPHVRSRGRWITTRAKPNYYRVNSAAGVNASASDLAKWLIAHLDDDPKVISDQMVDQLTSPQVRTRRAFRHALWRPYVRDAHYGLGWRILKWGQDKLVYHGGWVEGYRASISFSRDHNLGLAVLINAESEAIIPMLTKFWTMVLE